MVKTMNILPLILLVWGMAPNAGCTKEESGTITDPPGVVVTDTTHAIPGWQLAALAISVAFTGAVVSYAVGRWGAALPADREEE